jgi:hypothetical protein
MAENDSGRYWDPLVMQQAMSPQEKALRDKFVTEYLVDYDAWAACIRVGFLKTVAIEYAQHFMQEPYVQQEIARKQQAEAGDPKTQEAVERRLVKQWLIQEARYKGPGASHAARVAALGQLKNLLEMDGTKKSKKEITHRGGVMMVPAISNIDEWEKAAAAEQDKLIESSREDRETRTIN